MTHKLEIMRDRVEENQIQEQEKIMNQETKEGNQENTPPSLSSSPSHEFSFTISLHTQNQTKHSLSNPSFPSIDLSPADEIFFHGHLLPLHLSHLPLPHTPPRASANSLDNYTLPITQILHDQNPTNPLPNNSKDGSTKGTTKSKSFSLFALPKWRKGCEVSEKEDNGRRKKRPKFDVSHLVKKYMIPFWSFRGRSTSSNTQFYNQSHSYSGNLNSRLGGKRELRGRRGEFSSAPASMRTSPTNSGRIAAKENFAATTTNSTSDSTMEELQAAIQAAIAHCKNSVSMEEKNKIKCQD
ncbi:hypothetical protein LguiA_003792 [Lonicera macranthoides]